jgi:tetratricopeptide (TPR) repeat protein
LPARGGAKPDAWKLYIRAEYLGLRGDGARARDALERATAADDSLVAGHLALASMAQGRSDWDEAAARFRRMLVHAPNSVTALNDLAYLLADKKQTPAEALPLAARAYQLSNGLPIIGDTLAWTQHLLGRSTEAAPIIRQAAKQMTGNADVQWHAAVILAATGDTIAATRALDAAVKLNPAMAERFDVRSLRVRLQEAAPAPVAPVARPAPSRPAPAKPAPAKPAPK